MTPTNPDTNSTYIKHPESVPQYPANINKDKEREEARKLAKKLRKKIGKKEPIIVTEDNKVKKASELTIEEQMVEIIRCTNDPIYFIETYLTIFDQTKGDGGEIVPFKLFSFQKILIREYVNNRFVIANKYRQAGISTATCAYIAWYIMFNDNRQVAIVADKLETARDELMADVVDFIDGCPTWLKPKTGKVDGKNLKDTQKLKLYDNDSRLGAFSSKGLRGMTPTLLFWDETAWTENANAFWTSAKPTLQTGGSGIMVSCVTKDSFVYTNKGIKQMEDFIPNNREGAHTIDDYNVLGINKTRNGNIFFNNGYVDTLKIITSYSELETSYEHKYWAYTLRGKKYDWVKASDLTIGDYVSLQIGMNIWGENDDCSDFRPRKKITKENAYLFGLYLGNECNIETKKDIEFFEYLGFDLSKKPNEKIIPSRVLEMGKDNMISMILGIVDSSNVFNLNNIEKTIKITLPSYNLIKQLRIILGNFGILTEYYENTSKYELIIKNKYFYNYMNIIGLDEEIKHNEYNQTNIYNNLPKDSKVENQVGVLSENILWTKIKKIEKSKNYTYDFSLPNDIPEENEFNHSVIYNQMITHQTPNGQDEIFYKTFMGARKDPNHQFKAVEIWWFNDPRYNEGLKWIKNKGKDNEIEMVDTGWSDERRIQLYDDGWEATSPWFEGEVAGANGDMRKIAQEILCVFGDSLITIRNKKTGLVESIPIRDFYNRLESENLKCNVY